MKTNPLIARLRSDVDDLRAMVIIAPLEWRDTLMVSARNSRDAAYALESITSVGNPSALPELLRGLSVIENTSLCCDEYYHSTGDRPKHHLDCPVQRIKRLLTSCQIDEDALKEKP